jgi:hypothetical protein
LSATSATLKQVLKPKSAKKDKQVVGRNSSSTDRGCANWYCMSNCVVPEISVVIAVRGRAKGNRYSTCREQILSQGSRDPSLFSRSVTSLQREASHFRKRSTRRPPPPILITTTQKSTFELFFFTKLVSSPYRSASVSPHKRYSFDAITLEMV